ncbi:MAG: OmpA family protein, partial [Bacteroidota bacterium]
VVDLVSGEIIVTSKTNNRGEFLACLPLGSNYGLNVNKSGYLFHSENFELIDSLAQKTPFQLKIKLQPVPTKVAEETYVEATPIILKNVFFESGAATLKTASLAELNRLTQLLTENSALRIQINGHTDNVGSEADNLMLSKSRAAAVKNYLVEQGIAADRLQHEGFGESQPIADNETEVGRKANRRTEFVVLPSFSKQVPDHK